MQHHIPVPWLHRAWIGHRTVEGCLSASIGAIAEHQEPGAQYVYRQGPAKVLELALTQPAEVVIHLTIIGHHARPDRPADFRRGGPAVGSSA
ncbi:hypothetical protein ADL15_22100 [Actinoplanes awajinensis subsp. mycoplanecinus]|uniref:Uncharacterized protein n=1 Tax=Actinoplanes awajinensis subsp. mycoplanecinus TaxID=135947 RepID=A0A101JQV2_9ACTN|nr:hypothetical protein ADL15_22100 [Actinoplanes awajinensis subsp. mycoplanecinus]